MSGAPEQTEEIAREALRFVPGEPHALVVLVSTMRVRGERIAAQALLEKMLLDEPGIAALSFELGLLLAESGEFEAAAQRFFRVVELEPQHPAAWRALGDELCRTGDFEGAREAYGKQFASSIQDVLTLEQVMSLGGDQSVAATAMLREFLMIYPTDVAGTHMLAELYRRADQHHAAEELVARALELAPDFRSDGQLSGRLLAAARKLPSDPAGAAADVVQILRSVPGQQQALLLLASAHRAVDDTVSLRDKLEALAQSHPALASIHYELGLLLASLGERQQAIASLARVVALEPNHPSAWRLLGNQHDWNGDRAAAAEAYAQHIKLSIKELKLLEDAAANENDGASAENMLRQNLAVTPTDVMTIRMLAQKVLSNSRNQEATSLLEDAVRLAPDCVETRKDYARTLQQDLKWKESNEQFDIVIAAEPENAAALGAKAFNLVLLGESADAIDLLEKAREKLSNEPSYWLSYGNVLRTIGKSEPAIAAYRRSLELDPEFGPAWWGLANLKTQRFSPGETEMMLEQSKNERAHPEIRCHLEFALGKALEDSGDYERSFQHYCKGNELRCPRVAGNEENFAKLVEQTKSVFTREFFERREAGGCTSREPIFIVGLVRSGSTLIEQILSSHSAIEGTGELPDLIAIVRDLQARHPDIDYAGMLGELNGNELRDSGEQYIQSTRPQRRLGRPHFTDKAPLNFLYVGLIHLILPNARIIDARRHPIACCFSAYKQLFPMGSATHTYSLEDVGKNYQLYVDVMAHYDAVLPGRVHRVIYEELVRNPEAEIRRLLTYCGVEFEESCLRFHETGRGVRTVSSEQVRRPIYSEALDQWRNYEPWLGPLKAALGPVLDAYPAVPDF